jgi:hypothetical protein
MRARSSGAVAALYEPFRWRGSDRRRSTPWLSSQRRVSDLPGDDGPSASRPSNCGRDAAVSQSDRVRRAHTRTPVLRGRWARASTPPARLSGAAATPRRRDGRRLTARRRGRRPASQWHRGTAAPQHPPTLIPARRLGRRAAVLPSATRLGVFDADRAHGRGGPRRDRGAIGSRPRIRSRRLPSLRRVPRRSCPRPVPPCRCATVTPASYGAGAARPKHSRPGAAPSAREAVARLCAARGPYYADAVARRCAGCWPGPVRVARNSREEVRTATAQAAESNRHRWRFARDARLDNARRATSRLTSG